MKPERWKNTLQDEDVINIKLETLKRWQPRWEIWPFTYGIGLLGGVSALGGLYCNKGSRRMLNLGRNGMKTSFLVSSLLPVIMTVAGYTSLITLDLLKNKVQCTPCIQVRAAAVQASCGIIYPFATIPILSIHLASTHYTYRVPSLKNGKEFMKLWWSVSKSSSKHIYLLVVVNVVLAAVIAHQQGSLIERVNKHLIGNTIK